MRSPLLHCRPDIATWLGDDMLRRLFNEPTNGAEFKAIVAALLLLPEGWQAPQLLGQESRDPRGWLGRYVKLVMQVGFLWGLVGFLLGGGVVVGAGEQRPTPVAGALRQAGDAGTSVCCVARSRRWGGGGLCALPCFDGEA